MTDPTEIDLVEAYGEGSEFFDAPAAFFLTYEESIRKWADLEKVARSATIAFLESVGEELGAVALDRDWVSSAVDTGGYRHHLFNPAQTPLADDGTPAISCCFGWHQRQVRVTPHYYCPFVGVRVGVGSTLTSWRSAFLDGGEGHPRQLIGPKGYAKAKEWPVWKQVTGGDRWWANLDAYREHIRTVFEACLEDFAAEVERTVSEMGRVEEALGDRSPWQAPDAEDQRMNSDSGGMLP